MSFGEPWLEGGFLTGDNGWQGMTPANLYLSVMP